MPSLLSPEKILRLEVENFKSYKGHQIIGPFYYFTAIIGLNGARKSNLMDAISFVLGVRSVQLRGAQLKDLIYPMDNKEEQKGRRTFVRLVYQMGNGSELQFMSTITGSGGSEYRLDGKIVPWAEYNSKLKSLGILVKARKFLVFQPFGVHWCPFSGLTRLPSSFELRIESPMILSCYMMVLSILNDNSAPHLYQHLAHALLDLEQQIDGAPLRQPNPGLPLTHHRRVACQFRDQSLFQIFQISLTSLHQLKNDVASRLRELALSLSLKCLSFDFVGTSLDESSEEFGTVQIPSSWRPCYISVAFARFSEM